LNGHLNSLVGAVILTFNQGQVYRYYSETLDYATDISTTNCINYVFTADEYPVSLFGDLGT